MKLTDIKKLKVPELRSRLKELELDNRGLKAELVVRLWSALEAAPGGTDGEGELEPRHDGSPTTSAPTEAVDQLRAPASPPPTGAGVTARCELDRSRELTDSGTQTETDAGLLTPETGLPAPRRGARLAPGSGPECQAEDPGEDRRAPSAEEEEAAGRGRAFYEFKEEIRYKRSAV